MANAQSRLEVVIFASDQASKELESVASKIKSVGDQATAAGKSLSLRVTAPLTLLGAQALKTATNFDEVIKTVQGTAKASGAAADEIASLRDIAIEFGTKGVFGAQEVAEAMQDMVRDGLTPAQIAGGQLEAVYNLSAAAGVEMAASQIALSDTLQAFSLRTDEASRVSNVFAGILFNTPAALEDVAATMQNVAPIAGSLGASLEDVGILMGLMADRGIRASVAGTALSRGLLNLTTPTDQMKEVLDELNVSMFDAEGNFTGLLPAIKDLKKATADMSDEQKAQTLSTIFGARAVSSFAAILNSSEEDIENMAAAVEKAGVAQEIAEFRTTGLSGSLAKMRAQLTAVQLEIVQAAEPAILAVAEAIKNLATRFGELTPEQQKMILISAAVAAALGPILIGIGLLINSVGAIVGLMGVMAHAFSVAGLAIATTSPIVFVVIAALAALGVAIFLIIKHWDAIKEATISTWQSIMTFLKESIASISAFFSEGWLGIQMITQEVWATIMSALEATWTAILDAGKLFINAFIGAFALMLDFLLPGWDEFIASFTISTLNWLESMGSAISDFTLAMVEMFSGFWNELKTQFSAAGTILSTEIGAIWNSIKENTLSVWSSISEGFGAQLDAMKTFLFNNLDAMSQRFGGWIDKQIERVQKLFEAMDRMKQRISEPLKGVAGSVRNFAATTAANVVARGKGLTGLAEGGIVTAPTLALVGEAGPEAVVPLNGRSGMGSMVIINVTGNTILGDDEERLAQQVGNALVKQLGMNMRIGF